MITSTILGLLIPFIGTSLGAACVLFMKNELSVKTTKMLSGFAAGVMIAASVWSLLIPALEQSQSLGKMQFVPAVTGFMLGDDATKAQLAHGKALMELLKQPLCHPLSLHEQVMTLIMANHGVFDTIETKDVKKYQGDILSYMDLSYPEIGQKIEENRAIDEELVNKIMDAVKEYKG